MHETGGKSAQERMMSLDAYRGFTMLAMASAGFGLVQVAGSDALADSFLWDKVAYQFEHTLWRGCSFWDTIQPSFMFIVGAAMPFSFANRQARGQSWWHQFGHAVFRSVVLVLLAVFLSSQGHKHTNWVFTNVLAQIGLGYTFVFLLLGRPLWVQVAAIVAILVGYWGLFAAWPLPHRDFNWASVGIYPNWERLHDFAGHWEKNTNLATAFDVWFLNLFPQAEGHPFRYNPEGYATLNFVPSMATMLLGVLAGQLLRTRREATEKLVILLIAGTLGVVLGSVLDPQICPIVKRIWTPSWTLYSAGWATLELLAFYWLIDLRGLRWLGLPFVVVGLNSIAMYLMAQLTRGWVRRTLQIHFGRGLFAGLYGPIFASLAVLFVWWLVCYWMYRRKIFLRI